MLPFLLIFSKGYTCRVFLDDAFVLGIFEIKKNSLAYFETWHGHIEAFYHHAIPHYVRSDVLTCKVGDFTEVREQLLLEYGSHKQQIYLVCIRS